MIYVDNIWEVYFIGGSAWLERDTEASMTYSGEGESFF